MNKKNFLKKILNIFLIISTLTTFCLSFNVFADETNETGVSQSGEATGGLVPCTDHCTSEDLFGTVSDPIWARLIRTALGLTGIFILFMFIIGGIMLMVSGGNPAKIDKAKKMMFSSIIGLLIVVFAYLFVRFIIMFIAGDNYKIFFGQGN